jgi:hypothetical protein
LSYSTAYASELQNGEEGRQVVDESIYDEVENEI